MDYWHKLGAPKSKLVMGMPTYGQAFTLSNPSNNGLNADAPRKGMQGDFTRAAGFLAYYEVKYLFNIFNTHLHQLKTAEH